MPLDSKLKERGLLAAATALISAIFLFFVRASHYTADDGYISLRYVQNLLAGNGLVYNAGERVEGYTNFLWIMLIAGVKTLVPSLDLHRLSEVLGVGFSVLTIFLVLHFSFQLKERPLPFRLVGALFLAFHAGFIGWSTGGLETTMYACLVFVGAYAHVRALRDGKSPFIAPAIFALCAMTRPDGVIPLAVTAAHFAFTEWRKGGGLPLKRTALFLAPFAALFVPYFLWRYRYYGYPFPNTAYAKVGADFDQLVRGWKYLVSYGNLHGGYAFVVVIPVLLRKPREPWRDYFALLTFAYVLYIIAVGGDGLTLFRFFVFISPVAYVLLQEGFADLYERFKALSFLKDRGRVAPLAAGALSALAIATCLSSTVQIITLLVFTPKKARWTEPQSQVTFPGLGGNDHSFISFDNYFVVRLAKAGRWLDENAAPDAWAASTPAGSIAYHTRLRVIDMLGLNDVHIAHSKGAYENVKGKARAGHEKGDGKYVLERAPDYILMGNVAVLAFPLDEAMMARKLAYKSEHELWADPEFHARYRLVTVELAKGGLFRYFTFYQKKSLPLPAGALPPKEAAPVGSP
jgi:arabinofuranosyltransferase